MKNNEQIVENEIQDNELDNISGGAMTFQQAQDPSRYDTSIFSFFRRVGNLF